MRSQHGDPRVVAQRPRELTAADVDRDDVRRAGLEQAVGEPAGRRAGVEGPARRRRRRAKRSSAAASFSPPRDTNRGGSPATLDRLAGADQPGRRAAPGSRPTRDPPGRDRLDRLRGGSRAAPGARARRRVAGAQPPPQDTRQSVGSGQGGDEARARARRGRRRRTAAAGSGSPHRPAARPPRSRRRARARTASRARSASAPSVDGRSPTITPVVPKRSRTSADGRAPRACPRPRACARRRSRPRRRASPAPGISPPGIG